MPRRPAARATVPTVEALRIVADEHLTDDPTRPPVRATWDTLDDDQQRQTVEKADTAAGIAAWQAWMVGQPQGDRARLLGAVVDTLAVYAPTWRMS